MIERLGQVAHLEAHLDGFCQGLVVDFCSDGRVHVLVFIIIVIVDFVGVGHCEIVVDS